MAKSTVASLTGRVSVEYGQFTDLGFISEPPEKFLGMKYLSLGNHSKEDNTVVFYTSPTNYSERAFHVMPMVGDNLGVLAASRNGIYEGLSFPVTVNVRNIDEWVAKELYKTVGIDVSLKMVDPMEHSIENPNTLIYLGRGKIAPNTSEAIIPSSGKKYDLSLIPNSEIAEFLEEESKTTPRFREALALYNKKELL